MSEMKVSTFHHRGEIAEPRWMPIRWPIKSRIFAPKVTNGRAVEDPIETWMTFYVALPDGRPFRTTEIHPDRVNVTISAVDFYPLHSKLPSLAGVFDNLPLQRTAQGTTFRDSNGFKFNDLTIGEDWRGVYYDLSSEIHRAEWDIFARWNENDEIDGILKCGSVDVFAFPSCTLHKKHEPIFLEARFDRDVLNRLNEVELILDTAARCLRDL
ncbi:MAG: hypothetical protein AAGD04_00180 [Pseudomonadota bacterium]